MPSPAPSAPIHAAALDQSLRREGWSLHQRLATAAALEDDSTTGSRPGDLTAWRRVVGPDRPTNFDKRLAWDGLTSARATWALDPPDSAIPQDPPWWPLLQGLRQAASAASLLDTRPGESACSSLSGRGLSLPFVHAWRPAASWALELLQQRCDSLAPDLQPSEEAWLDLAEALLERLCTTTDQALWELFNGRRSPGQMLLAHLGTNGDGSGEPVHEAYDAFVAELLSSGYGLLLSPFPVLGRLLAVITELWLEGSEEMLRRLAVSRPALEHSFAIPQVAPLQRVQLGLSDPHRGGRVVAILGFGDASSADVGANVSREGLARVVYKPKDMQVDQSYQDFLATLNLGSSLPPLRRLTVLSLDGYGFMEWLEHRPCDGEEQLARFYTNAGRTMAVLHLLGCTDCHYENLIAHGDQLLLIDTETLLEGDLQDLISDDADDPDLTSSLKASMQRSVLRSGLLPQWLMLRAGRRSAIDVSALGIQPPPPQRQSPGWLGLNSDGMMAGRSLQPSALPTSLPVGLGSEQRLTDFVEELCAGFTAQLLEVIRLRPRLLEALQAFRGQPRRLVARATRIYFTIQRQMLEPGALRDAVAHGLRLEQLCRSYVLASEKPSNWAMLQAELLQMERLDIPFFLHWIDREDLPLPEGLEPIPGFLKASGLAAGERHLHSLDRFEIDVQQQLIRGAIAACHLRTRPSPVAADPAGAPAHDLRPAPPEVYRQEAFRLGEELWTAAIRDRLERPEWLGMDLGADGESFQFGLIGPSLYSGSSGIALLFARLALVAGGAEASLWRQRAWACFEGLAARAARNSNDQLYRLMRDLPYGLVGSGGVLLTLTLLEQAGIPEASPLASLLIQQLRPERLAMDQGVDVIGGVTGLIGPLLLRNTPESLALAEACGDRLLALQLESGGWPPASALPGQSAPLTGLSHGAAGMAAGLARLAQATGEARFAEAARRAVAYERGVFVQEEGNWPDFRSSDAATQFMRTWCHGAPGILLSRHGLQTAGLGDAAMTSELAVARGSTLAGLTRIAGSAADPPAHLCCGALGLTSLLRLDARLSGTALDAIVSAAESRLIRQAQRTGAYTLFSVDAGSLNLPGLFTGQAGVALALLEASAGPLWMAPVLSAGLLAPG